MDQDVLQSYLDKLKEVDFYLSQGLSDGAIGILEKTLQEIECSSLPPEQKRDAWTCVDQYLKRLADMDPHGEDDPVVPPHAHQAPDPEQCYYYGVALMDGRFWEEAIHEFERAFSA